MEKNELRYDDFVEAVNPFYRDFVNGVNDYLIENGCKIKLDLAKNGYLVSYSHTKSKRVIINFVFRKNNLVIRIYGDNYNGYADFMETLPDGMIKAINGSAVCTGVVNHIVNADASDVSDLMFKVEYPKAGTWRLDLNCTPFKVKDRPSAPVANAVAVAREGSSPPIMFAGSGTVVMYKHTSFLDDLGNSKASYNGDSEVGTWGWDRLAYDIKVETNPGGYQTNETHESLFTWTLIMAP